MWYKRIYYFKSLTFNGLQCDKFKYERIKPKRSDKTCKNCIRQDFSVIYELKPGQSNQSPHINTCYNSECHCSITMVIDYGSIWIDQPITFFTILCALCWICSAKTCIFSPLGGSTRTTLKLLRYKFHTFQNHRTTLLTDQWLLYYNMYWTLHNVNFTLIHVISYIYICYTRYVHICIWPYFYWTGAWTMATMKMIKAITKKRADPFITSSIRYTCICHWIFFSIYQLIFDHIFNR